MDDNWLLNRMGQTDEINVLDKEKALVVSKDINTQRDNNMIISTNQNEIQNINNRNSLNKTSNGYVNNLGNNQGNANLNFSMPKSHYEIKQEVSQNLNESMVNVKDPTDNFLRTEILRFLNEYSIPEIEKNEILKEIMWDLKGYGIIQPFLDDESVTEIMCCRYDNIWIEKGGQMQQTEVRFANEKELRNLIDKIVNPLGRRIDDAQPYVNARLIDKSRVNAVINPISADGATLDIRKFARQVFTMQDYIDKGSMIPEMSEFIKWITVTRKNVVVSGGTGSGKTTLLNCISRFIPEKEAIITIEDLLELQLVQPCVRRLEARSANAEGKGAVTIRDLVANALRMRPDRIIIGECRSSEVVDMLQAANTGHDGTMTSVHANNAKDSIERLATMYLFSGLEIQEKAIKSQISSAIHVIVQAQRLDSGERKIIQISEVLGLGRVGADKNNEHVEKYGLDPKFFIKGVDNNQVYIQDIFKYDEINKCFVRTGWVPTFFDQMKMKGCPLTTNSFSYAIV